MACTFKSSEDGDDLLLSFTRSLDNCGMAMSISVSAPKDIGCADWRRLIDGDHKIYFGDCYGSHVDNDNIIISTEGDNATFEIYSARGETFSFLKRKSATI